MADKNTGWGKYVALLEASSTSEGGHSSEIKWSGAILGLTINAIEEVTSDLRLSVEVTIGLAFLFKVIGGDKVMSTLEVNGQWLQASGGIAPVRERLNY